jgi:fatty acid desaturase
MKSDNDIIVAHPHQPVAKVPVVLSRDVLVSLSTIRPAPALIAVIEEWTIIAATIALAVVADHWAVTLLAILIIGARQHALGILAHDAAHYRFLPNRAWNDWIGNIFLAWPVFLSLAVFRSHHGPHHRFAGGNADGNRIIWGSHDKDGKLVPQWNFPKSRAGFALGVIKKTALVHGMRWIIGGTGMLWGARGSFWSLLRHRIGTKMLCRFGWYTGVAGLAVASGAVTEAIIYWVVPYCTWHMTANYIRVICEHSGKISDHHDFKLSRSTLPGLVGRAFILPRNIGYHLEHHWYPSVPWYNLPALHEVLRRDPVFSAHANVQRSIGASLRQCLAR